MKAPLIWRKDTINMSMDRYRYVFVDTWAWIALSNRKDTHHEVAKREYEVIKAAGYRMVTSDYVLDEVITALFRNVAFGSAVLMFRCVCINRIFQITRVQTHTLLAPGRVYY